MKGKLITLEGISGIGKTFYSKKLQNALKNEDVIFHKEITDEIHRGINKKIFSILQSTNSKFFDTGNPKMETLLIAAKQCNDEENAIIPALKEGTTVISDRGLDTICIYQGILFAKKYGGSPIDYVLGLYSTLSQFCLVPDKTFVFTGNVKKAINRAESRDSDHYTPEEIQILSLASRLYLQIAERFPDRFVLVDVDKYNVDENLKKIIEEINLNSNNSRDYDDESSL